MIFKPHFGKSDIAKQSLINPTITYCTPILHPCKSLNINVEFWILAEVELISFLSKDIKYKDVCRKNIFSCSKDNTYE